jgi:uncharacterized protein
MQGNRTGIFTTLGGGLLIFSVWQVALELSHTYHISLGIVSFSEEVAFSLLACVRLLLGFGPALFVMVLWRQFIEARRPTTLFTAAPNFRWKLALASAFCVVVLVAALTLIFDQEGSAAFYRRASTIGIRDWLAITVIYGLGICVQATFEEIFIRAWLLQHMSRLILNPIGAIAISALVFSAVHFGIPGWATFVITFVFGLIFGWSALRLNGLEAAIGGHIGNNMIGAVLFGRMASGNSLAMDAADFTFYALYVLGFLLFVEAWVRFAEKPSRT